MTCFHVKDLICSVKNTVLGVQPPARQGYLPGLWFDFMFRVYAYQGEKEFAAQSRIEVIALGDTFAFVRTAETGWQNTCRSGECFRTKGLHMIEELYFRLADQVIEQIPTKGLAGSARKINFTAVESTKHLWQPIEARIVQGDGRKVVFTDLKFVPNLTPWGFVPKTKKHENHAILYRHRTQ